MHPDTEADTEPAGPDTPTRDLMRLAFPALLGCTIAVALVSFALSFYGLEDYGRQVMGLPYGLSAGVPIGVDLFSLCGIAATYMLRRAAWRIRAYAWLVFCVPTGLSVAGNIAHAQHRGLGQAGIGGAAAFPVILALATHLVVVVRRYLDSGAGPGTRHPDADPPDTDEFEQLTPVSAPPDPATDDADDADTAKDLAMARAIRARRGGATWAQTADAAGVDERTVRRWFGQLAARPPARPASRRPAAARVNGSANRADTTDSGSRSDFPAAAARPGE